MNGGTRQADTVVRMAMTITAAAPSPEAKERWERRAEVLAAWLVGEWRREQGRAKAMVLQERDLN